MRYEDKTLYEIKKELNEIEKISNFKIEDNVSYKIYKKNLYNIEGVQRYFKLIDYKYPIIDLNNKINKNKLSISVQTTKEAISLINSINLFKYIGCCNSNSRYKEKLIISMSYSYNMILKSSEEAKSILENKKNKDIYILEYKSAYREFIEVYTPKESYYKICLNKEKEEYYIAIYNSKESEKYIKYNFIDFYTILAGISKKQALVKLINLLEVEVIDVKEIIRTCNENLDVLSKFGYTDIDSFILFSLIEKHIYVLKEIINISLVESYFYNKNKKIGEIYFSLRYLANKIKKDESSIVSIVNGFCLLGFINKRILSEIIYKKNVVYTINSFDMELFINAIKIAKKLRGATPKIKLSSINKKNISRVFGEEVANSVFLA